MMVEPPRRLGDYEVLGKLAEGAMGRVYRALDRRSRDEVALKLLHPKIQFDPALRERFVREALIAQRVEHPNVVRVRELGEVHLFGAERTLFFAMELIAGRDLLHHVSFGSLSQRAIADIGRQLAAALAVVHSRGVVHRDIKPSNVLLRGDGQVKILDFGLAKVTEGELEPEEGAVYATQIGALVGTAGYASPEQLLGEEATPKSDLYSLAALLYQLLGGRLPLGGTSRGELIDAMFSRPAEPLSGLAPGVDRGLERIVMRNLAPDAKKRHPSAQHLANELATLLDDPTSGVDRPLDIPPERAVAPRGDAAAQSLGVGRRLSAWWRRR